MKIKVVPLGNLKVIPLERPKQVVWDGYTEVLFIVSSHLLYACKRPLLRWSYDSNSKVHLG